VTGQERNLSPYLLLYLQKIALVEMKTLNAIDIFLLTDKHYARILKVHPLQRTMSYRGKAWPVTSCPFL
jgi:hypothetical protein